MATDQQSAEYAIKTIGLVRSSLKNIDDCPLQGNEGAPEATIDIFPEYADGLDGLEVGSEIIVLTWFHQSDRSVIKTYPRKMVDHPPVGVFTTRSPARPNPVGLHRVKITAVEKCSIKVKPMEALDGTPVIDIKPVIRDDV
jgi:L-fuculose-phosphate aldolase